MPESQASLAVVAKAGNQVLIPNKPFPARSRGPRNDRLSRQIQIHCPCDIHAIFCDEESKRGTDPGVDVQELVLSIARIIAVADVQDAFVAKSCHELGGGLPHRLVLDTNP